MKYCFAAQSSEQQFSTGAAAKETGCFLPFWRSFSLRMKNISSGTNRHPRSRWKYKGFGMPNRHVCPHIYSFDISRTAIMIMKIMIWFFIWNKKTPSTMNRIPISRRWSAYTVLKIKKPSFEGSKRSISLMRFRSYLVLSLTIRGTGLTVPHVFLRCLW